MKPFLTWTAALALSGMTLLADAVPAGQLPDDDPGERREGDTGCDGRSPSTTGGKWKPSRRPAGRPADRARDRRSAAFTPMSRTPPSPGRPFRSPRSSRSSTPPDTAGLQAGAGTGRLGGGVLEGGPNGTCSSTSAPDRSVRTGWTTDESLRNGRPLHHCCVPGESAAGGPISSGMRSQAHLRGLWRRHDRMEEAAVVLRLDRA